MLKTLQECSEHWKFQILTAKELIKERQTCWYICPWFHLTISFNFLLWPPGLLRALSCFVMQYKLEFYSDYDLVFPLS